MMALWQYHLIGRVVDDVSDFKVMDPRGHGDSDFALKTRVRWSKNVMEERQCPPQILLDSMDPLFCVLLQLGIYLEEYLHHPNADYLFTEFNTENATKNLKQTYRNRLERVVWKNREFKDLAEEDDTEGVGTHSYRKFPSNNYARGCGAAPDEIEIRGRWKSQGGQKVVFRYIDVKQLTIDAKVVGILCFGSPIKYKYKPGVTTLTDD
jgi:hypothetical protein